MSLTDQVANLPLDPGVYLFRDAGGVVIYVGKAKSIRVRVRNYFNGDDRHQIPFLLHEAHSVDPFITSTEKEALLLENTLIKQHQPRYNIELKDDKNYLCLRIDTQQKYPRVEIVRKMREDKARYFGPYHSAGQIRETVRLINRHFQLRTCKDSVFKNRSRPCLQYQIKRCPAPCVIDVDQAAYHQSIDDAAAFLGGRETDLLTRLAERMRSAAGNEDFEIAAQLRDQIEAIRSSLEKQRVMSADLEDRDVFGVARQGERVVVQLMWVRDGKLRGGRTFDVESSVIPSPELLEDALRNYYEKTPGVPREVLLPFEIEGQDALQAWLRDLRGAAVDVYVPERGPKKKLVAMAETNASHRLKTSVETNALALKTLERLQRSLRLHNFPERIECYDISNMQGGQVVGSQVVFEDGLPAPAEYRMYRIKTVVGQDDFASMREMLTRRFKRGLEEGELPSLIVIDGGVGQLNVARAVFEDLGVEGVDLASLAKSRLLSHDQGFLGDDRMGEKNVDDNDVGDDARTPDGDKPSAEEMRRSPERIFLPGQKNPIVMKPYAQELLLLTHLRDEAHRFAITFHRKLRKKRGLGSVLDELSGLGPKRKKLLLKHFGSVQAFLQSPPEALQSVPGIPDSVLAQVREALRNKSDRE